MVLPRPTKSRKERNFTMNNDNRAPLTILGACTLLARETVSMLEGLDQLPDSAVTLRGALALAGEDLGDSGALLAWVDSEMEMVRHFAETNEQTKPLVELEVPCAIPDPIMQLDASCILLKAAAQPQPTEAQWQSTLEAVRLLMEIDGLDDIVLTAKAPSGGFLRVQDLRSQLERVQAAFRGNQQEAGVSPREAAFSEVEAPAPEEGLTGHSGPMWPSKTPQASSGWDAGGVSGIMPLPPEPTGYSQLKCALRPIKAARLHTHRIS